MIRRLCLAALAAFALPASAMAQFGPPQDRYIVVLNEGLDLPEDVAADVALRTGGRVGHVYEHALRGFSITMPRVALAGVTRDPRVNYVEEDKPVSIFAQNVPTGIQRIFADGNTNIDIDGTDDYRVNVDVAVIDTGIDLDHPELNVVGGTDCSGGGPFNASCSEGGDDNNDHGTHVAGTIGAIDDGDGVVGVAPGARLYAVKVLKSNGSGWVSGIVAGIDWVAKRADIIEVANMSLGGAGFSQAEYDAIQGAVNKGIAFAVAAGNSDDEAANYSPAAFDNVLTVSALADFNGEPGGLSLPTCRDDQDDTLADFSNWSKVGAVQVAAPGVCIFSTLPGGGYGTFSGTSMASPHAAGALALLASDETNNPSNNATDVQNLYNKVINAGNSDWQDDSEDGTKEPLLDVSSTIVFNPGLVAGGGDGGGVGDTNSAPTASFINDACVAGESCQFTDTSTDSDGTVSSWAWDFDGNGVTDSSVQNPTYTFATGGDHLVTLTVTDNDNAFDSVTQTVSVSSSGSGTPDACDSLGDGVHLSSSSTNQGNTWTAIVDAVKCSGGDEVAFVGDGVWDPDFGSGTNCIESSTGVCEATQSGIQKRDSSVGFSIDGQSIIVTKP